VGGQVVNFLFSKWEAKHVSIGLFEVSDTDTSDSAMAPKIFAYIKDEGSNLHRNVIL
jgi:hypothetical protein